MEQKFITKFAETEQEKIQAYSLRYTDMLKEYNPNVYIENGLDITPYDDYAKQIICIDTEINQVVGVYRIITSDNLPQGKHFACEEEFDFNQLKNTGEKIAELSRAVIKREYRNTMVLTYLLRFIITYLEENGYRYAIGEASFYGTDKSKYIKEITYLANIAPITEFNISSLESQQVTPLPIDQIDLQETKRALPPLIRAYLSFGAKVSKDTSLDTPFGSVDVFILLDLQNYNKSYIKRLLRI